VPKREARMGIRARVHYSAIAASGKPVHSINELSLAVMLLEHQFHVQLGRHIAQPRFQLREGDAAVERGLTRAEQVQVGAIEDCDSHDFLKPSSHARKPSSSSACGSAASPAPVDATSGVAGVSSSGMASLKNWSNEKVGAGRGVMRCDVPAP